MKITIDEDVCSKYGMSISELIASLLVKTTEDIPQLFDDMLKRQIIVKENGINDKFLITQHWNDVVESIILDSDKDHQPVDRLDNLATKLQAMFPEGKKEGTTQYWRGNKREISLKLKKFFKLYGSIYTDEQILTAAQKYVDSFNGRLSHMRVLKYFIWKDERRTMEDGQIKVVEVSDLATYIENANSETTVSDDWASVLS